MISTPPLSVAGQLTLFPESSSSRTGLLVSVSGMALWLGILFSLTTIFQGLYHLLGFSDFTLCWSGLHPKHFRLLAKFGTPAGRGFLYVPLIFSTEKLLGQARVAIRSDPVFPPHFSRLSSRSPHSPAPVTHRQEGSYHHHSLRASRPNHDEIL